MRSRSFHFLLATAVIAVFGACAHRPVLVPAPAVSGPAGEAQVTAPGVDVRLRVRGGDAWRGFPQNLNEVVVPLRVTVQNDSEQPMRLRYDDFQLVQPDGRTLAALPPLDIEGRTYVYGEPAYGGAWDPRFAPGFHHYRFFPYQPYAELWGLSPWGGRFAYDPWYYQTYQPRWPVDLPSPDMMARALPEGVLEPGGRISGFLYFEQVPKGVERVTLHASLVAADDRSALGEVRIPLDVR